MTVTFIVELLLETFLRYVRLIVSFLLGLGWLSRAFMTTCTPVNKTFFLEKFIRHENFGSLHPREWKENQTQSHLHLVNCSCLLHFHVTM